MKGGNIMKNKKNILFYCRNKECGFYIRKGEEKWLPLYADSHNNIWCPCCHNKMVKNDFEVYYKKDC